MKKAGFRQRFSYNFENTMSSGPGAVIKWLSVVSLILVLLGGIIIWVFKIKSVGAETDQPLGFWEGIWQSMMSLLDPGNVGNDPSTAWPFRIIRLFATFGGIFITSILIGTISSGITEGISQLKKGRSKVLETNHTLILGWSEKIFTIIKQIIEANSNHRDQSIVILASRNKEEMDDMIRSKISHFKTTRVICRSGSPMELSDIPVVNPNDARSIIVLAGDGEHPDIYTIKSVLALTNGKERKHSPYHIVAEIKDPAYLEAASLVGNDETVFVLTSDFISKVTAQTCRQSGLSIVYTNLLEFEGGEIYFKEEKSLVGKTFKDALFAYESSTVIGLLTKEGEALLNLPPATMINEGDQIIVISEDDDTILLSGKTDFSINEELFSSKNGSPNAIEKTLVLGWNNRGNKVIKELDNYVAVGSVVMVMADTASFEEDMNKLRDELQTLEIHFKKGNINQKSSLEALKPETYNHIIVLSYTDIPIQESDAKTLICLLHLRNMGKKEASHFTIVSEMLDIRNRELAAVARADDFIVSENLSSLILCQVSENKELKKVYDILFAAEGSEIYLKPVSQYVNPGKEMDFYTVLESAARQNEIAIGYRIAAKSDKPADNHGIKLNPLKSERIQFSEEDRVIVLAEN